MFIENVLAIERDALIIKPIYILVRNIQSHNSHQPWHLHPAIISIIERLLYEKI